MPTFKVYARQWVEELGSAEIEADTKAQAIKAAEEGDPDWDWSDGNDINEFEVIGADLISEEEPEEEDEEEPGE